MGARRKEIALVNMRQSNVPTQNICIFVPYSSKKFYPSKNNKA